MSNKDFLNNKLAFIRVLLSTQITIGLGCTAWLWTYYEIITSDRGLLVCVLLTGSSWGIYHFSVKHRQYNQEIKKEK